MRTHFHIYLYTLIDTHKTHETDKETFMNISNTPHKRQLNILSEEKPITHAQRSQCLFGTLQNLFCLRCLRGDFRCVFPFLLPCFRFPVASNWASFTKVPCQLWRNIKLKFWKFWSFCFRSKYLLLNHACQFRRISLLCTLEREREERKKVKRESVWERREIMR